MDEKSDANPVDLYYELHIQPLFRPSDRLNMLAHRIDLWKYEDVVTGKAKILQRIKFPATDMALMPPLNFGGPWPAEWISLIQRWYDSGTKRLARSAGTYNASRASGLITLTARIQTPGPDYAAWFDQLPDRATPYEFVIYEKPGGKLPVGFTIRLRFADPGPSLTTIVLFDKNGRQEIPIS